MATKEQLEDTGHCPVCRTLPLNTLTFGVEGPLLEYHLSDDEGDLDLDNDKKFEKCALYYLVRSLRQIWLGREDFAAYSTVTSESPSLRYSCGGQMVIIDQNIPLARLHVPRRYRAVHSDPRSPLVTARLQEWIQTCDSNHEGCRIEEIPLLPTRVLDVGEASSSSVIKLVETGGSKRGQYIALSHCWGKSKLLITTRDNLEDMKNGFVLEKAPATFRDAITISRGLGVRFLWIDSLCIIQGDVQDWEKESSRMSGVYRDATLMLSASYATDDSEGFLKSRLSTHSTLKITSPWGQSIEVYLRLQETGQYSGYWDSQNSRVVPLDTRGWCLQEAYLCRRQLKFLDNKILWTCRDAQLDESEKDSFSGLAGTGTALTTDNLLRDSVPRRHRSLNLLTPYQGWYRMVKDYTRRNLTVVSDKFPAISGLAVVVAEHDKGNYCAGVWWEDVAFGICWKKSSTLSRIDNYMAPSWSWASVDGPIEFIDANELYLTQTKLTLMTSVTFHDFHVENRGLNQYGQIDNASIRLEAPIASLKRVDEELFQISGMERPAERDDLSFDFDGESKEELVALFLLRRLDNSQETQLIHMGIEKGVLGVILFGLIIRAVPHLSERCKGLGLQDGAQVYKRVGSFRILTSEGRESEFWGKAVQSIVLV